MTGSVICPTEFIGIIAMNTTTRVVKVLAVISRIIASFRPLDALHIGRLTGRGTKGLTLSERGPHVDKVKFPSVALVRLQIFLTGPGKSVTIIRKVPAPKNPAIEPADDGINAALAEIADHPETMSSCREIIRFILVEPMKLGNGGAK